MTVIRVPAALVESVTLEAGDMVITLMDVPEVVVAGHRADESDDEELVGRVIAYAREHGKLPGVRAARTLCARPGFRSCNQDTAYRILGKAEAVWEVTRPG